MNITLFLTLITGKYPHIKDYTYFLLWFTNTSKDAHIFPPNSLGEGGASI